MSFLLILLYGNIYVKIIYLFFNFVCSTEK